MNRKQNTQYLKQAFNSKGHIVYRTYIHFMLPIYCTESTIPLAQRRQISIILGVSSPAKPTLLASPQVSNDNKGKMCNVTQYQTYHAIVRTYDVPTRQYLNPLYVSGLAPARQRPNYTGKQPFLLYLITLIEKGIRVIFVYFSWRVGW